MSGSGIDQISLMKRELDLCSRQSKLCTPRQRSTRLCNYISPPNFWRIKFEKVSKIRRIPKGVIFCQRRVSVEYNHKEKIIRIVGAEACGHRSYYIYTCNFRKQPTIENIRQIPSNNDNKPRNYRQQAFMKSTWL